MAKRVIRWPIGTLHSTVKRKSNRPFSRCENLNWRARCLLHDDIVGSMRLDTPEYVIDHAQKLSQSLLLAVSTCNKRQARQFKFSHLEKGLLTLEEVLYSS